MPETSPPRIRLLVSVRDAAEAALARDHGADLIDVGGVKFAPGEPVPAAEESDRVVPVVAALRERLPRHVLLNAALSPLCYAAGVRGDWDEQAAASLVDVVLLGTPAEVDAVLRGAEVNERQLIAHGASLPALEEGHYVEAVQPVAVGSDWERVRRHDGR